MRVGVYLNVDSYLAHADYLSRAFLEAGFQIDWLMAGHGGASRVTLRQIRRAAGADRPISAAPWRVVSGVEEAAQALAPCDVALLGVAGPAGRRIIRRMRRITASPPVSIACFPGVHYAGQTLGQWSRLFADLILFNEPRSYEDYRAACDRLFRCGSDNAMLFGYPSLALSASGPQPPRDPNLIVYVDQTILPASLADRLTLLESLDRLAQARPQARIVIAARVAPDELTSHGGGDGTHVASVLARLRADGRAAERLEISYDDPRPLVRSAGLCLGITSTLLLEAMHHGTPTVPLITPGVNGPFNGFRLFQQSPMAMPMAALTAGAAPVPPDPAWRARHILAPTEDAVRALVSRLEALRRNGGTRRPGPFATLPRQVAQPFCARWDRTRHALIGIEEGG